MSWLKAIWQAILAFLASRKGDEAAAHQAAQAAQDQLVQETQEAINEVPGKTDTQLTDTAVDLGLVQPKSPSGASGLGTGIHDLSGSGEYRKRTPSE